MKDYDYVKVFSSDDYAEACLYVSNQKVLGIGDKMNEIDEYAYMNGYNWEAFLNCYFAKKEPALLEGMKTDPEAEMLHSDRIINPTLFHHHYHVKTGIILLHFQLMKL